MFSYLSNERLGEILTAFERTLPYDSSMRSLLMSGIDVAFVSSLNNHPNNRFQLMGDVNTLNSVERIADGSIPLAVWLRNAAMVFSPREEAKIFHRALDDLHKIASGAPLISDATNVPEVPEAIVAANDMVSYGFLYAGTQAGLSVARLRVPRYDNGIASRTLEGNPIIFLGSGWLASSDLLITNYHVINARKEGEPPASPADLKLQAQNIKAYFDYDADGEEGTILSVVNIESAHAGLDYTLLRLSEPLTRAPLKILNRQQQTALQDYVPVNIIQHPLGGPKKVALRNNLIYDSTFPKLRYFTDTDHGSSGSPVFNDKWQVVALHRASTFVENVTFQGRKTGWVNEGTQIAAILTEIEQQNANAYQAIAVNLQQ